MARITQYQTIAAGTLEELDKFVNDAIESGWTPFGSLVVDLNTSEGGESDALYIQTMVVTGIPASGQ